MELSSIVKKVLLDLAVACKDKGGEYYDKKDLNKTAIFWELESIFKRIAKNVEEEPSRK